MVLNNCQGEGESEVAQSCLTRWDPMDCSPPGSSVHGIFQQEYWSGVPLPSPSPLALQCYKPPSIVLQALFLPDLIP